MSFWRLWPYWNKHKLLFYGGIISSTINGFTFPSFGILMARVIVAESRFQMGIDQEQNRQNVQIYYLIAIGVSVIGAICGSISMITFSLVAK